MAGYFNNNLYGGNYGYNPALNPNLTPQQRIAQYDAMQMQQNQMQPPVQQQPQQMLPMIKAYYVANADEAKAVQTPFDYSIIVLIDKSLDEIYIKRLDNSGNADFRVYSAGKIESKPDELSELRKRIESLEKSSETQTASKNNKKGEKADVQ